MDEALQMQLALLGEEVRAAAIPPGSCQHAAAWCLKELPGLYSKFRLTNESRYGEQIARLLQGLLNELAKIGRAFPGSNTLSASIVDRVRLVHEEFGLPRLELKVPRPTPRRSRKTG